MHSRHLLRVLKIFMDHSLTGQFTHTHDVVGIIHAILLNGIHCRIDIAATTVEISSVHMNHQWFARHLLGMNSCRIRQPVVRMNDIKLLLTRYHPGNDRIVIDLFMQIVRITSGKFDASQIIRIETTEVSVDMVAQVIEQLRVHIASYTSFHIIPTDILPHYRCAVHTDNS